MSIRAAVVASLAVAASQAFAAPVFAVGSDLAGAPQSGAQRYEAPQYEAPQGAYGEQPQLDDQQAGDHGLGDHGWGGSRWDHHHWASRKMAQASGRHESQCFAKVRYGAQYAPPPNGPEYVWRQAPPPPGAPGPIWCLTVQPFGAGPTLISPERYGWIRVLCDDDATPDRIADVQRRLHARGLYRGRIDGRYDEHTAWAVRRFQSERRIEDRGYLSYDTMAALEGPPPPPPGYGYGCGGCGRPSWGRATTFDTGVITWPGKVLF